MVYGIKKYRNPLNVFVLTNPKSFLVVFLSQPKNIMNKTATKRVGWCRRYFSISCIKFTPIIQVKTLGNAIRQTFILYTRTRYFKHRRPTGLDFVFGITRVSIQNKYLSYVQCSEK